MEGNPPTRDNSPSYKQGLSYSIIKFDFNVIKYSLSYQRLTRPTFLKKIAFSKIFC